MSWQNSNTLIAKKKAIRLLSMSRLKMSKKSEKLWLAFPLLFSTHGIFVNHNNALASVQRSMMLTRMTLPTTSLFILAILVISEGLDLLWRIPPETSWLTLLGISGHAFISSALLAASVVYYRDADHWTQETIRKIKAQREMPLQGT